MLNGLQRLKGAIDSRIAEEQARQRQATQQGPTQHPARSSSLRRSNSNTLSPAGRRPRTPDIGGDKPQGRGPDPAEFDPDVVVGEDDPLSRSTTPHPPNEKDEAAQQPPAENGDAAKGEKEGADPARDAKSAALTELPTEVRVRLRKLEKLEPKYSGILLLSCRADIR